MAGIVVQSCYFCFLIAKTLVVGFEKKIQDFKILQLHLLFQSESFQHEKTHKVDLLDKQESFQDKSISSRILNTGNLLGAVSKLSKITLCRG